MSAYLYFTTESFLLLLFRHLISELTEWNSAISGQMVGHKRNLKTHVQYLGYPLPIQIWGPKTTFLGRLRNLTVTLTAYIFGVKQDIHKWSSALQITRGLLHRTKTTCTLVHKRLQIRSEFSPTLHKFCIPLHCQASQTEISQGRIKH